MEKRTVTVALENKCCVCHTTIKAGTDAIITQGESYFDLRHVECPPLADNTGPRVIQGKKK